MIYLSETTGSNAADYHLIITGLSQHVLTAYMDRTIHTIPDLWFLGLDLDLRQI